MSDARLTDPRASSRVSRIALPAHVDEIIAGLGQPPPHRVVRIRPERKRCDVESRPIVGFQQSRDQIRGGMRMEVSREVSDTYAIVPVMLRERRQRALRWVPRAHPDLRGPPL